MLIEIQYSSISRSCSKTRPSSQPLVYVLQWLIIKEFLHLFVLQIGALMTQKFCDKVC